MRKLVLLVSAAALRGLAGSPVTPTFAGESSRPGPARSAVQFAFSLDEMNCFSSDVRARSTTPDAEAAGPAGLLLAGESGGGTNGIPCPRRDPKSTPAQRQHG